MRGPFTLMHCSDEPCGADRFVPGLAEALPDIVTDGVDGWFFSQGDAGELAQALNAVDVEDVDSARSPGPHRRRVEP